MLAKVIGTPAMLEQTAEECVELAKACLKYARHLRGENKVWNDIEEMRANIIEETADVLVCFEELENTGVLSVNALEPVIGYKQERMKKRLEADDIKVERFLNQDGTISRELR